MASAVTIHEKLVINNTSPVTGKCAAETASYLEQFNSMTGLEKIAVSRIAVTADRAVAEICCRGMCGLAGEPGYYVTYGGDGLQDVSELEDVLWEKNSQMAQTVDYLAGARHIEVVIEAEIMGDTDGLYGPGHWKPMFEHSDSENLRANVGYACHEEYEKEWKNAAYAYGILSNIG